eukprot:scaffold1483_cov374-Pavlova_lutheri.AAC.12
MNSFPFESKLLILSKGRGRFPWHHRASFDPLGMRLGICRGRLFGPCGWIFSPWVLAPILHLPFLGAGHNAIIARVVPDISGWWRISIATGTILERKRGRVPWSICTLVRRKRIHHHHQKHHDQNPPTSAWNMKPNWEPPPLPAWPTACGLPTLVASDERQTRRDGYVHAGRNQVCEGPWKEKKPEAWAWWKQMGAPKYWVAPMVDQSELAFRLLCKKNGTEGAYTPMIHARMFLTDPIYRTEAFTSLVGTPSEGSGTDMKADPNADDRPLIAQFCANDGEIWLEAAQAVAPYVDAVDLNLGCPQRIARRGKYGAFLMDHLENVETMVKYVVARLNVPVTAKIRVFDDLASTLAYAKMLEQAGCSMVAVHGRTRDMKRAREYPPDWRAIRAVREAVNIPVLANGGVRSLEEANALMAFTGAQGVLSAEPLLENPAIFKPRSVVEDGIKDGAEPSGREMALEKAKLLTEYLDLTKEHETPLRMIKAHMHRMAGKWLAEFVDLREAINAKTPPPDRTKLEEIGGEISRRIHAAVRAGRYDAIPKLTERALARLEQEEAKELAISQQTAEEDNAAAPPSVTATLSPGTVKAV